MKTYLLKLGSSFLRFFCSGFCCSTPSRRFDAPCACACCGCVARAHVCVFPVRRRLVVHVHACGWPVLSFCSLLRLPSCGLDLSASNLFGSFFVFRACFLVFCFFCLLCFVLVLCSSCCLMYDLFSAEVSCCRQDASITCYYLIRPRFGQ